MKDAGGAGTMSLRDGAAYLGIGQNAIYGYVRAGQIQIVRFPGRKFVRVTREALDAFRDAHTGTIGGTIEEPQAVQVHQTMGHLEVSPTLTKRREAQLDEMFARK